MRITAPQSSRVRLASILIGCTAFALAAPQSTNAQHKAKISKGLAQQISEGGAALSVIYEGPQAEADRLAAAYGLTVTKRLQGGAVLKGAASAVTALSTDAGVAALSAGAGFALWNETPDARRIATLAIVVVGGNMRLHLWFTARTYPGELASQLTHTGRLVRAADVAFSLVMIGIGLLIADGHPGWSALFVSFGLGAALAFLIIEPATARAAFGAKVERN